MAYNVTPEEMLRVVGQTIPSEESSCVFSVNMSTGETEAMCGSKDLGVIVNAYKSAPYQYLAYPTAAFRKKNFLIRSCASVPGATTTTRAGTMVCVVQKNLPAAN